MLYFAPSTFSHSAGAKPRKNNKLASGVWSWALKPPRSAGDGPKEVAISVLRLWMIAKSAMPSSVDVVGAALMVASVSGL